MFRDWWPLFCGEDNAPNCRVIRTKPPLRSSCNPNLLIVLKLSVKYATQIVRYIIVLTVSKFTVLFRSLHQDRCLYIIMLHPDEERYYEVWSSYLISETIWESLYMLRDVSLYLEEFKQARECCNGIIKHGFPTYKCTYTCNTSFNNHSSFFKLVKKGGQV